jgi:hypothetical protein
MRHGAQKEKANPYTFVQRDWPYCLYIYNIRHAPASADDEQQEHGDQRHIADDMLDGRIIAAVFTWRGEFRRLMSARRARRYERQHDQIIVGAGG